MSDGALVIKIANKELLKIMKNHKDARTFGETYINSIIGCKYKGKTLAIDYEDYDRAGLSRCPEKLSDVLDLVLEFFELYSDDIDKECYKALEQEIKEKRNTIDENYSFIDWLYYYDDSEEKFHYEKGVATYTCE